MSTLILGRSHINAKKVNIFFLSQRTNLKDYTCKLLLSRNFKNTISVEHDFQGLVLSNYKHSCGRETIQMLRVCSKVKKTVTLTTLSKFIQEEINIRAKSVEQVFQRVVSKTATCATIKSQVNSCTLL